MGIMLMQYFRFAISNLQFRKQDEYSFLQKVNKEEILSSGILESYCLGLASQDERHQIELLASQDAEIKTALEEVNHSLESFVKKQATLPPVSIKNKLMLQIYEMESGAGKKYPPLIKENTSGKDFTDWLNAHPLPNPEMNAFENLHTYDLPGTAEVTNFAVWAKQGHEDEEHNDFLEYMVILKGSCDMFISGVRNHFEAGEIIRIPKDCVHYAVITSDEPMLAIVQRVAA